MPSQMPTHMPRQRLMTCGDTVRSRRRSQYRKGARLASASLPFHVDVNVGDPIWPAPSTVEVPRRGGEPIVLVGCPIHMVHAEKIVTAIQRGVANTRWRDFGDIWTLSRRHSIAASDLREAIDTVARHRGAQLSTLSEVLDGFADLAQVAGPPGADAVTPTTCRNRSLRCSMPLPASLIQ